MSRPKKRRPNDPVTMSQKQLENYRHEIAWRTMVLFIAYSMDELGYDKDKIVDVWAKVNDWADSIDKRKLITIETVCTIINNETGLDMRW